MKCEGLAGTPLYIAPEIYKQQEENMNVSRHNRTDLIRSDAHGTINDMWSLGIILCQLILGKLMSNDLFGDTEGKDWSTIIQEFDIDAKLAEKTAMDAKLK